MNAAHTEGRIIPILAEGYGSEEAGRLWFHRCGAFFRACSELFGMNCGNEWFVGQYLFQKDP